MGFVGRRIRAHSRLHEKIDKNILSYLVWAEAAPKNPSYASNNGAIYRREDAALLKVPRNVSGVFEIPDGVKKVGDRAFWCRRDGIIRTW